VVALSPDREGSGEGHEDLQSDFRVETHTTGLLTTLRLSGELDLLSSPALERELQHANASDCGVILLDLRELEFMDSTGLHVLVKAHQRAQEAGRSLVMTKGGDQVQRLLDLTGVAELIRIVDSPEQLLEADQARDGL
jgi:anti-sigma B factor antagonist